MASEAIRIFAGSNLPTHGGLHPDVDLVLPVANFLESVQTFINLNGLYQTTAKIFNTDRRQLPEVLEALFLFVGQSPTFGNQQRNFASYLGATTNTKQSPFLLLGRDYGCFTKRVDARMRGKHFSVNASDYYTTDVISQSSKTMLNCSKMFNKQKPVSTF